MKTFWKFQILYKKVVKKPRGGGIKTQPINGQKQTGGQTIDLNSNLDLWAFIYVQWVSADKK